MSLISPVRLCARCSRHRQPLSLRSYSQSASRTQTTPLKLAIIGAGPSGFYTASRVLASIPADSPRGADVEVHMYERLPTPYGLVRYGVAPDHPEVKNCQHKFDELAKDPRFRYFGNVLVTSQPSIPSESTSASTVDAADQPRTALSPYTYPHALRLPLSAISAHYNALLLSYGASLSNPLSSVAGSSSSSSPLRNVHPALALVGWYNGHPAFADLPIDLSGITDVAIVGQGNVALDVARILLKPVSALAQTDLPERVLDVLSRSTVRRVTAVGRRGPGQVAFTTKEFREMINIPDVSFAGLSPEQVEEARGMVQGDRMRTRLLGLMEKPGKHEGDKEFHLDFLKSPLAFEGTGEEGGDVAGAGAVGAVEWAHNSLLVPADGADASAASRASIVARPTGETSTTHANMVVESVGYRSEPLGPVGPANTWSLPFDERRGRISNASGRVTSEEGVVVPGVYAAGWVSRGPIGVIASTMQDAYTVADQLLADHYEAPAAIAPADTAGTAPALTRNPDAGAPRAVEQGLKEGTVVDLDRWGRIGAAEREAGKARGKEREKFTRVEEMLAV